MSTDRLAVHQLTDWRCSNTKEKRRQIKHCSTYHGQNEKEIYNIHTGNRNLDRKFFAYNEEPMVSETRQPNNCVPLIVK